jgi:predicted Zn-dependent protease
MARARLDRRALLLTGVAALLAAPPARAQMLSNLRSAIPGTGFSVSGKPGPFIKQVAKRTLQPGGAAGEEALGFNSGDFQTARLKMPQTQARLEALLQKIDALWPYAKPPAIRVNMVADGSFGPNSLRDGTVSVPVGFLALAESDDEVAFVMAHEYAHLALGHFARNERMKTQRKLVTQAGQIYASGVGLSQMRLQRSGQQVNLAIADQRKVEAAHDKALRSKEGLDWVLNILVEPAWNRRQEDEADAIGYDLALAMGYSPADGAAAAFTRMESDNKAKQAMTAQLQTQIEESLAEASSAQNQAALKRGDANPFLASFRSSVQSGLKDRALRATENFLSAQHRPPQVRQKGIADYSQAAYPQAPLADLKTTWLTQTRASKEFTSARTAVNALQRAQQARYVANYPAAEAAIKQALATPYGNLPLFLNEAARIYRDKGDLRGAEAQFTRADAHPEQTYDGFFDHVTMCIDQRNYPRALAVIAAYKARSKTDKEFLPQLIHIKFKQGRSEEAVALLQRCVDYEEPKLREACAMSAFGPEDDEWDKLPDSAKFRIREATGKAATKLAMGPNLGDLLKNLQKSAD